MGAAVVLTGRLFGGLGVWGSRDSAESSTRRVGIVSAVNVVCLVRSGRSRSGLPPAAVCFAAQSGSVLAFECEQLGVAGMGVAPTKIRAERAGERGVVGVVAVRDHELA